MFTDAGVVIAPPTAKGQTPLHCVCKLSIASQLIALGADVSATDDQGEIPLHKASLLGNLKLVCLYLNAGTLIDKQNNLG